MCLRLWSLHVAVYTNSVYTRTVHVCTHSDTLCMYTRTVHLYERTVHMHTRSAYTHAQCIYTRTVHRKIELVLHCRRMKQIFSLAAQELKIVEYIESQSKSPFDAHSKTQQNGSPCPRLRSSSGMQIELRRGLVASIKYFMPTRVADSVSVRSGCEGVSCSLWTGCG